MRIPDVKSQKPKIQQMSNLRLVRFLVNIPQAIERFGASADPPTAVQVLGATIELLHTSNVEAAKVLTGLFCKFGQLDHGGRDFFRRRCIADGDAVQAVQVGVDFFHCCRLLF